MEKLPKHIYSRHCKLFICAGKTFNKFYAEHSVLKAETKQIKLSLNFAYKTYAKFSQHGLKLLGIEAPEKCKPNECLLLYRNRSLSIINFEARSTSVSISVLRNCLRSPSTP
ncbi:MAG: hypothetical protein IPH61_15225 [Bacteroidetes bacterium]|nr:hypothetical protein [Bacteroidota bacterium]